MHANIFGAQSNVARIRSVNLQRPLQSAGELHVTVEKG